MACSSSAAVQSNLMLQAIGLKRTTTNVNVRSLLLILAFGEINSLERGSTSNTVENFTSNSVENDIVTLRIIWHRILLDIWPRN